MENRINIGELDTLVGVYSCTIVQGSQGDQSYTLTHHSDVFAKVSRDFNEAIGDGNYNEEQTVTLTIYKISGMTTRWQIEISDKMYEIRSINPISRISPLAELTLHNIEGE